MHVNETAKRLFVLSYTALAAGLTIFTLYLCYAIEWRGPFRDLWEFIGPIQNQLNGQWDWNRLIEPYGGIHRILIPKLLFYLDYRFAAGSNLLALSVTITLHLAACFLFIRSILSSSTINREDSLLLIATTLLFWFSTTQIYNLVYISDNQVVISNGLAIFAGWFFCFLYLDRGQSRYLYLTNLLIILACLSHSSSLMMWPAIILAMLLLEKPKKEIQIQVAMLVFILGLYVSGHDPLDTSTVTIPLWQKLIISLHNILTHIEGILRYIGLHLSSPTSRDYTTLGIIISYLSIAYLLLIFYRVYSKRWQPDKSDVFWIILACYGLLIAVITACGRQIYPNSALTDRYQTLVMTYWAAWTALLYVDIKRHKPVLVFLVPAFSLALLFPYQYKNAEEMAWLSSRVTIAHTAAIVGITDMDTVAATLSHPLLMDKKNLVEKYNNFFRESKIAYFNDDAAKYFWKENINQPFPEAIEINPHCSGQLLSINKTTPGDFKFSGQGETGDSKIVETVLVMDNQHKIIGMARSHRQKGYFLPLRFQNSGAAEWIGFIHLASQPAYPLTFLGKGPNGYCSLFAKTTLEM